MSERDYHALVAEAWDYKQDPYVPTTNQNTDSNAAVFVVVLVCSLVIVTACLCCTAYHIRNRRSQVEFREPTTTI